jgi:hypothetical protein
MAVGKNAANAGMKKQNRPLRGGFVCQGVTLTLEGGEKPQ